jgi:hypothetical protein
MSVASVLSFQSAGSALSHQSTGSVLSSQSNRALLGRRTDGGVPVGIIAGAVAVTLAGIALHRLRRGCLIGSTSAAGVVGPSV